jgi:hypothetical protein
MLGEQEAVDREGVGEAGSAARATVTQPPSGPATYRRQPGRRAVPQPQLVDVAHAATPMADQSSGHQGI